ncbi:MAG: LytTR family DNA-binding domain-containing protein [Burkholderiales bacterium]|nr:LytTR family DNA-binding domain-containing protein [Burkholderiales bacterium]
MRARAVIAEDEPLLAEALKKELASLWPELEVVAVAGDGESAVAQALAHRPEVVFLDIRMPGMDGLEAAQALAEDWPDSEGPFPLLVFVTAYDQYALQAFERAAVDYVLKPVQPARLAATVRRLQATLAARSATAPDDGLAVMVERLRGLLGPAAAATRGGGDESEPLRVLQVGVGNSIHMVKIDDVVYFEAADKYVRVITEKREHLIRISLRELLPRLDTARFWQIHRGTVVRAEAIASAEREESGRVTLRLVGRPEKLVVSRLHAHRFKAM